jgi:hypothetical protein
VNPATSEELELKDILKVGNEMFFVSTIKMEVRHSWLTQHQNVNIYESMVFEKIDDKIIYENSIYNRRYTTSDNAIEGHNHIVKNIESIITTCSGCKTKLSK